MVSFGSSQRYYVWQGSVDFRKGFDGLQGLVSEQFSHNGLDGGVYVFFNRRRTQVKMLVWDGSGFVIYYKRLERGTFEGSFRGSGASPMSWFDLQLILEGIRVAVVKRRKRYQRA
jgi:hypothetical protein